MFAVALKLKGNNLALPRMVVSLCLFIGTGIFLGSFRK
jgi:hypothetical protein